MSQAGCIVICGVGLKGASFIEGVLQRGINIGSIVTYPQQDDRARSFERLRDLALRLSIDLLETRHPVLQSENLTFLVGWQHLLVTATPSTVVFHDSLLPRYRGFAPTVTALIKGDREIGVTALSPAEALDAGPIIAQRALPISYPMKIETALQLQAGLMVDIAVDIVEHWRRDELHRRPNGKTWRRSVFGGTTLITKSTGLTVPTPSSVLLMQWAILTRALVPQLAEPGPYAYLTLLSFLTCTLKFEKPEKSGDLITDAQW